MGRGDLIVGAMALGAIAGECLGQGAGAPIPFEIRLVITHPAAVAGTAVKQWPMGAFSYGGGGCEWAPALPPAAAPNDRLFRFALFVGATRISNEATLDVYGNMIGLPAFTGGYWVDAPGLYLIRRRTAAELTATFTTMSAVYDRFLGGAARAPEDEQGIWRKTDGAPGNTIFDGYPRVSGINRDPQDRALSLSEDYGPPFHISTFLPAISTPDYVAPELYLGSTAKPIWVISAPADLASSLEFVPPPPGNRIEAEPERVPGTAASVSGMVFRSARAYVRVSPGPGGPGEHHIFEDTVKTSWADPADPGAHLPKSVDLGSLDRAELWAIIGINGPGTYTFDLVLEAEGDERPDAVAEHNRAELDGHPLPGNPPEAIVGKRVLQTIHLVVVPPSIEAGDGGRMSGMIITR